MSDHHSAMQEGRRGLFESYMKLVIFVNLMSADADIIIIQQNRQRMQQEIRNFLLCRISSTPGVKYYKVYLELIQLNVDKDPYWSADKGAEAFTHMEQYALNVYCKPWKQLYDKIKKYTGPYHTLVSVHLERAETILEKMGYRNCHSFYTINKAAKQDRNNLEIIAFECFFAAVECKIIHEIFLTVRRKNYTVAQVLKCRLNFSGNIQDSADWLEEKMKPEGNLKLVDKEPEVVEDTVGQLRRDPKGRLLHTESSSGYSSEYSPAATIHQHRRLQDINTLLVTDSASQDRPINLVPLDTNIADRIGNVSFSEDEDIYEAPEDDANKAMNFDDHLKHSMQLVQMAPKIPPVAPSHDEQWGYVDRSLRKTYGDQYFIGLRPDLLQSNKQTDNEEQRKKKKVPTATLR